MAMKAKRPSLAVARVSRPDRAQVQMHFFSWDQMLPNDHRARLVWDFVESLDLTPLYDQIKVSACTAGRPAVAPEVLVGLWLLATLDGIGSARELNRRCSSDIPYLWMRGDVSVNYHTLSDFRSEQVDFLDSLLVDSVTVLIAQGLVPMETVAQDGMRVRANAGKSSFRRKPTLENLQEQAQEHVERLKKEHESEREPRQQAAQERAARERSERLDEALRQHEALSQQREKRRQGEGVKTRVSTTDPDARNMKMANGGYDPAYNVQFITDGDSRVIVGVEVTNEGTDGGQLAPMVEQVSKHYGRRPKKVLVDSAYATKAGVTETERGGTKVVSTVPRSEQLEKHGKNPHERQKGDSDEYVEFRKRMSQEEYQILYKQRPSIAEFPNAVCRNRNLRQLQVRGLMKVKAVALLYALAFNFSRMINLGVLGG
jgi:transposase/IS5 family transposase